MDSSMETLTNRVLGWIILSIAAFWAATAMVPIDRLIIALNGLLVGTAVAIAVSYGLIFLDAIFSRPYDRVRQMTLGVLVVWIAIGLAVGGSIYTKMADIPNQNTVMVAASRLAAIIAAILQVTAPDFGRGFLHGRDRKVLAGGMVVGLAVALFVIYGQATMILAAK